jgi:hypothetical protein
MVQRLSNSRRGVLRVPPELKSQLGRGLILARVARYVAASGIDGAWLRPASRQAAMRERRPTVVALVLHTHESTEVGAVPTIVNLCYDEAWLIGLSCPFLPKLERPGRPYGVVSSAQGGETVRAHMRSMAD